MKTGTTEEDVAGKRDTYGRVPSTVNSHSSLYLGHLVWGREEEKLGQESP